MQPDSVPGMRSPRRIHRCRPHSPCTTLLPLVTLRPLQRQAHGAMRCCGPTQKRRLHRHARMQTKRRSSLICWCVTLSVEIPLGRRPSIISFFAFANSVQLDAETELQTSASRRLSTDSQEARESLASRLRSELKQVRTLLLAPFLLGLVFAF